MRKKTILSLSIKKKPPDKITLKLQRKTLQRKLQNHIQIQNENQKIALQNSNTNSKRIDKTVDKKLQKFFTYHVYKFRLNTILNSNPKENLKSIVLINQIVQRINLMAELAYKFANFYLLNLLKENKSIPKIDQSFFYKIICSVSTQNGKLTTPKRKLETETEYNFFLSILEKFRNQFSSIHSFPSRDNQCFFITPLTQEMQTATNNHLSLNFASRFGKYLKEIEDVINPAQRSFIFMSIFNSRADHPCKFDQDQRVQELIQKYQNNWNHPKDLNALEDQSFTLPIYYQMLLAMEQTESKTFSILPSKGTLIPGHIKICNSALPDLLALRFEKEKPTFYRNQMTNQECWNQIFGIPDKPKMWFGQIVTTNGYDVSVSYQRPRTEFKFSQHDWSLLSLEEQNQILTDLLDKNPHLKGTKISKKNQEKIQKEKMEKYKKLIISNPNFSDRVLVGNDPGNRFLFTMVDREGISSRKQSGKKLKGALRCSGKEFKHLTGQTMRLKEINKRMESVPCLKQLNELSLKTADPKQYLKRFKAQLEILPEVRKEYQRYFYRKMGFMANQKRIKTFYELVDRIEKRYENAVIGWGTGGTNQKGLKGSHMPNKTFRKFVERNSTMSLIDVDEYKTSQMCYGCHEKTENVYYWKEIDRKGERCRVKAKIYGLRRCENNECRITIDRDLNACQNILEIVENDLLSLERPSYLKRNKEQKEKPA